MTPEESLAWLFSTQQFGMKLGLENIRLLLKGLGHPEKELAIIHVAGTNGKGSVCAMTDAISRASGRRTGLYTSPHLVDFRERVRVDGVKIAPARVAAILAEIRRLTEAWERQPTFFEIVTALALRHFADERCELVVLETGLGGRLDATNATVPRATVITPVDFDHTKWLGETLAEIAGEKAGIIKPGVPVISAPQQPEARVVLEEVCRTAGTSLRFIETNWEGGEIALCGAVQRQNAAVAIAGLEAAGLAATEEAIQEGLRSVRWPGRFHVLEGGIVLDGGHNPQACRQLVLNWQAAYGDEKANMIFGALADKAYGEMLEIIRPIAKRISFVPVKNERSCDPAELAAKWSGPAQIYSNVAEAYAANDERPLLIAGSLFLVGEAFEVLGVEV